MSVANIKSAVTLGLDAVPVEVEGDLSNGLPSFSIVGLPDKAVEEAKERVRSAIKNSGLEFPAKRITINLAPADLKKEGPIFDLAIAIAILRGSGQLATDPSEYMFVGELSLEGNLRHTKGVLPIVHHAKTSKTKKIILPAQNLAEARIVPGINIYPATDLRQVFYHLRDERNIEPVSDELPPLSKDSASPAGFDLSYIKGQEYAKRALEIAAAGGHNILLFGPPGSGKTMLARSLPSILPPLDYEEILEVTKIYSVTGLLGEHQSIITERPFRSPHHTSSDIALVGGGRIPRPGEITLSHRGVLFLDELPEFSRSVLEVMRQPLEDGIVNVARATQTVVFPAQFMLVASQNPCPCGFLGDPTKHCICTPAQIMRYKKKISGPLIDRIDMHLEVPRVEIDKLSRSSNGEASATVRRRVAAARQLQTKRYFGRGIKCNAEMGQPEINDLAQITEAATTILKEAAETLDLSARSYFRMIKLARTIADLAGSEMIEEQHVAEALQFRPRSI